MRAKSRHLLFKTVEIDEDEETAAFIAKLIGRGNCSRYYGQPECKKGYHGYFGGKATRVTLEWMCSAAHDVDLLLKDVMNIQLIKSIVDKFVKKRRALLKHFRKTQVTFSQRYNTSYRRSLTTPVVTRWKIVKAVFADIGFMKRFPRKT
ncbi:hypothetical protein GN244_ATG17567 [Phytophthora infestans]|uniref:Uncharacterized protein n=1 Tax=Phytophthora infestans TaxID=4787 RepID=A0A833SS77_PHYIN|nr:hypothetical protein GN244_ATG17567 [Phytophthora infestans]